MSSLAFLPPEDRNLTPRTDHDELRAEFEALMFQMTDHFVDAGDCFSQVTLQHACDEILDLFDSLEDEKGTQA